LHICSFEPTKVKQIIAIFVAKILLMQLLQSSKFQFLVLLLIFFIINIFRSKYTGLWFDDELGVRFFSTINFTIMLYTIWLLIDINQKRLYSSSLLAIHYKNPLNGYPLAA
jgi:hypothetical protein